MDSQKRMRVSTRHWDLLLDLLDQHPEMVTGKFTCQNAKQKSIQLWKNAAEQFFRFREKKPRKWKIALQDWKYKTKIKVAEIKDHDKKTGGGPPLKIKLNEQEERLLNIVGWTATLGNENVPESGFLSIQPGLKGNAVGNTELPKAGTSTELQDFGDFNMSFEDDQAEILVISVEENHEENKNSTDSNKRQQTEKKTESTTRSKCATEDILNTYQKETMDVLKEICNGINNISTELKNISQSLSTNKHDSFF